MFFFFGAHHVAINHQERALKIGTLKK